MMIPVERDKWLLGLLEKHFKPYEFSEEEMSVAAKSLADTIDSEIIETIIQKAKNENSTDH